MNKKLLLSILTGLTLYTANANAELYFSQDSNGNGLFEINVTTGAATLVGAGISGVTSSTVGLAPSADPTVLFGTTFKDLVEIQTDGSAAPFIANTFSPSAIEGLAYCSGNNTLYGGGNNSFQSINQTTGIQTSLAGVSSGGQGLACDSATNTIYGIGRSNNNLEAYNIGTNTWSTVGDTGIGWGQPGLAWDSGAGVLYAIRNSDNSLYSIDPVTAAATLIGPLGTNAVGGLAFVGASAPLTPQAVPTLSFWGLMIAIFGLGLIGRRRIKK